MNYDSYCMTAQLSIRPPALGLPQAPAFTLTPWRAAGLLVGVLLVHLVVLWWARGELQSNGFAAPPKVMYSRLILPTPPEAAQAAVATVAVRTAAKPSAQSVAKAPRSPRVISLAAPAEGRVIDATDAPPAAVAPPEPQAQVEPPTLAASAPNIANNSDTPRRSDAEPTNNLRISVITNDSMPNEMRSNWAPSSKVSYSLTGYYRGDLHGSGAFEWLREGPDSYQLFLRVKSLVGIEYRSRGKIDGAALKPERYEEQLPRGVTSVSFNYDAQQVSFSRITDVIPMTPGIQDRASAIMTLVSAVARDARRIDDAQRSGELIKVPVASPTGTDIWEFKVIAQETVNATSGPVQAWHLQRLARKPNGDLGVDLWLSQALRGLPVRIKLTLSADTYLDLTMTKAEQE